MSGGAEPDRVVALCGGVGGAKLAHGLAAILGAGLTIVVNTADDFDHLGLAISPDIDTVLYTLGGLADRERGWGRAGETWNFMKALAEVGGETWFQLGDLDLALHVERTRRLAAGLSLTEIVGDVARRFGIAADVLPMTDDPVRTIVDTDEGRLAFQRYFVERRAAPRLRSITFDGAAQAALSSDVAAALREPGLRAIVICPSNPYLSVDPILAVPGMKELLAEARVPRVAVSPIIGGAAVKGPTAKIMAELGVPLTSRAIAQHYDGLIDGLVVDDADSGDDAITGVRLTATDILMTSDNDRERLARETLAFADAIAAGRSRRKAASA